MIKPQTEQRVAESLHSMKLHTGYIVGHMLMIVKVKPQDKNIDYVPAAHKSWRHYQPLRDHLEPISSATALYENIIRAYLFKL